MTYWFDITESQRSPKYTSDRLIYRRMKYTIMRGNRYELWKWRKADQLHDYWMLVRINDIRAVLTDSRVKIALHSADTEIQIQRLFKNLYG